MFANNIVIIDHDHVIGGNGVTGELTARPVIIEDHVWCGANVTISGMGRAGLLGTGLQQSRSIKIFPA